MGNYVITTHGELRERRQEVLRPGENGDHRDRQHCHQAMAHTAAVTWIGNPAQHLKQAADLAVGYHYRWQIRRNTRMRH